MHTNWFIESKGHLAWFGNEELINVNGNIFKASRANQFDPDGFRYGMYTDSWTRSVTPEEALNKIKETERKYPDYQLLRINGRPDLLP